MSVIPFEHKMAAHCESGTVTALLNHAGVPITEPMVFGIGAGIYFGYLRTRVLPFPTFVVRSLPGWIRKSLARRLGIKFEQARSRDPAKGMAALDELLTRDVPVGVQADFFYMDYIPEYARAHFNAHYVTVVGKEDGEYLISDSYSPGVAGLAAAKLETARFVKGPFAPRGFMFFPTSVPEKIDFPAAIRDGIKRAAFYMLKVPVPFLGVRGIRCFARKVQEWPKYARDEEHLSHEIMMIHVILEERGTGGGGFRFLYAAFLQEAAGVLGNDELGEMSGAMMENGDRWRDISLFVARIGKRRELGADRLRELGEMVMARADAEEKIFHRLADIVK